MTKERLPQNMSVILQEIGENSVLFHLFLMTTENDWTIFKNLSDKGCDIILAKFDSIDSPENKLRIEVKTRQKLHSTSSDKKNFDRQAQFNLTEAEYTSCDFLVAFWFDLNAYFILPKNDLKKVGKTSVKYRFTAKRLKDDSFNDASQAYLNNWQEIKQRLN